MTNNNPWKGLESYKYSDANRFYGRGQELSELAEIVRQNTFTTIYGVSGAGKTSIINAGLCPLLKKEKFLPVYIRLNHGKDRISYDQQIINATEKILASIGGEAEKSHDVDIESEYDKLWLYFHSHTFWTQDNHKIAPVLFIDQFEEIFTKNDDVNDIWSFFNVIDSLQYNMPTERILELIQQTDKSITFGEEPNFRVVFSMREDFLPRLEDYCFDIPAMRRNRVGLKSLNGLQAIEVITKPCPEIVTREVALHIISKVVGKKIHDSAKNLKGTLVDTSILSLFCTELYNYRDLSKDGGAITKELVDLYGGNILEWFYDRNMQILPKNTYIYLENHLLTHNGFRNSVAIDDLLENNVTQEQIDRLEENRIIRVEDINHNLRVEFTHDVLCKIARKRKEERDSISKAKDEATARRLFTFDTVVFALATIFPFINAFYVGFSDGFLFSMLLLPFICILYLIFIHRSLPDKSFSIIIGSIFACLALFGLTAFAGVFCANKSNTYIADILGGYLVISVPYIFVTSPFLYNIYCEIEDKLTSKNRKKYSALLYFSIPMLLLSICRYLVPLTDGEKWCILSPLILLVLSPFGILANARIRNHIKPINIFSVFYSGYICLIALLFALRYYNILNLVERSNIAHPNKPFELYFGVAGMSIAIMAIVYMVAYIRQPKEIGIRMYLDNIMEVQSFRKYKSFSVRFVTILVLAFIAVAGIIGTTYIDYIPFVTLPITVILSMYVISKEIKFTITKKVFSKLVLVPSIVTTELILALQYIHIPFRFITAILICILSSAAIFYYFCHTENIQTNKWLAIRITIYSLLISFLLPSLCVGYNLLNPNISNVSRVWGGRISSNQNRMYFMTIADENGNKGVMDYSDIIINPSYENIGNAYISSSSFADLYPLVYEIQNLLSIESRQDETIDTLDSSSNQAEEQIAFLCRQKDGTYTKHDKYLFLTSLSKYGRIISRKEIDNLTYKPYYDDNVIDNITDRGEISNSLKTILSPKNLNVTDEDRRNAITRIFINKIFKYGAQRSDDTEGEEYYDNYDYYLKSATINRRCSFW